MAERKNDTDLNTVLFQVDEEIRKNQEERDQMPIGQPARRFWTQLLIGRSPTSFPPGYSKARPRLVGIALEAFKLGLLIGGRKLDLEDVFRSASIDYNSGSSIGNLPIRPVDDQGRPLKGGHNE